MFKLEIRTDSAAFADDYRDEEIGRILRDVVKRLENGRTSGKIQDVNGNSVGGFGFYESDEAAPGPQGGE